MGRESKRGFDRLQSAVGRGTNFQSVFPLVRASARGEKSVAYVGPIAGKAGTVLLAEDQTSIRETVRECLEVNGYKVLEAENGEEALDIAKLYSGTIDVLVDGHHHAPSRALSSPRG